MDFDQEEVEVLKSISFLKGVRRWKLLRVTLVRSCSRKMDVFHLVLMIVIEHPHTA